MHSSHDLEQKLKDDHSKKMVRFSSDKIDRRPSVRTYEDMKRGFLKLLASNQFEKIKEHHDSYAAHEIEEFYATQGGSLFSWAMIDAPSVKPLGFLVENVPLAIMDDILQANDFSILRIFLGIQKTREEINYFPEEKKRLAMEKIATLLQANNPTIVNFIDESTPSSIKQELKKSTSKLK